MTRRAAQSVAHPVKSTTDSVSVYLPSTLIELLGLVEILLYAAVHQLSHLLARAVLFLRAGRGALGLIAVRFVELVRDTGGAWWENLVHGIACHVLLVADHRALLGDALRGVVEEHSRVVLPGLLLAGTVTVHDVLAVLLVEVLDVLHALLVVLLVH